MAALKKRRDELITLIRENVNLRCQRERGQTVEHLKKTIKMQTKGFADLAQKVATMSETNMNMAGMLDKQADLEAASSSKLDLSTETVAAEMKRKAEALQQTKLERDAKRQAKEAVMKAKNPEAFAARQESAAASKAQAAAKAEAKKVAAAKVRAEAAAERAAKKAEELAEKARDPVAFAEKQASKKVAEAEETKETKEFRAKSGEAVASLEARAARKDGEREDTESEDLKTE